MKNEMNELEFKHWIVVFVIIIAALLAAGLSIYQYLDAVQKERKNDLLQNKLIDTQADLNKAQGETIKRVMGHGYARVIAAPVNNENFELLLESKSDFPIYETEVYVYDQDQINQCPKFDKNGEPHILYACYVKCGVGIKINTLTSKKIRPLKVEKSLKKKEYHFEIKTLTKHNSVFQYSIIESDFEKRTLIHYFRVFELLNGEFILMEKDDLNINDKRFEEIFSFKKDAKMIYN